MTDNTSSLFLMVWHDVMEVLSIAFFVGGIAIYVVYMVRLAAIIDPRQKYDFISSHELKWLKWVFYLFSLGVAMLINMYGANDVTEMGEWFFVRAFASMGGATLVAYVASIVLDFQYSAVLSRKLNRWRYKPRVNPDTGTTMRLFNESEDFVRLNKTASSAGQVRSMDYDVWIDMSAGDIKIEEYDSRLAYLICRNCGYHTMRVVDEEMIEKEEEDVSHELLRHYRCSYCKNIRATQFYVSTKSEGDYKDQQPGEVLHTQNVDMVKMEIRSVLFGKKFYEFDSLDKAKEFLNEYGSV